MDYIEEFDDLKTKVLKYILYKKRTEQEVRQKFKGCKEDMLNDIIDYLKDLNYINDIEYIEKTIKEYKNMKSMSIKEITYKLLGKGIKKDFIEKYVDENKEGLLDYELKSARKLMVKKKGTQKREDIINLLIRKGYLRRYYKNNKK